MKYWNWEKNNACECLTAWFVRLWGKEADEITLSIIDLEKLHIISKAVQLEASQEHKSLINLLKLSIMDAYYQHLES